MSPIAQAVRLGLRRGLLEFGHSIRSTQDWGYYLFTAAATFAYLYLRRNSTVPGTDLTVPTVALPGILALLLTFGLLFGISSALVAAREDGTLLRAKATPNGVVGYTIGQLVFHSLSLLPQFAVILVPAALLLGEAAPDGPSGWLRALVFLALGITALLPLGIVVGCAMPDTRRMFCLGVLSIFALAALSGIFVPVQQLWGWLQPVGQVFPLYWLGLGLRSAFLPADAAAAEIGGSWRTGLALAVLVGWTLVGVVTAPWLLRRTARRQSGSAVESARLQAVQWGQ